MNEVKIPSIEWHSLDCNVVDRLICKVTVYSVAEENDKPHDSSVYIENFFNGVQVCFNCVTGHCY